jgi:hypothetical protein
VDFFYWHNPVGRTVAPGSTQPLTEMSTRNICRGGKNCLHVPIVLKSGSLDLLEPSGPVQACNGTALPLYTISVILRARYGQQTIHVVMTV